MLRYLAVLSCVALAGCAAADRAPPAAPNSSANYAFPPTSATSPPADAPQQDERRYEVAAQSVAGVSKTMEMSKKVSVASFGDDQLAGGSFAPSGAAAPAPPPPPPPPPPQAAPAKTETRPATTQAPHERGMLVYTARVTLSVYQVEQGLSKVEQIAKDLGGYLSVRNDRDITVRVPRERFEEALTSIDKIGDVLHRDVQAQDVTDQYVDMEIRIKNGRAMQTRLKALLEKASVKEALELEKELKRVTEELELLEGKLKLLSAQIAYSTVTVMFQPHGAALTSSKVRLPFPWLGALGLPSLLRLSETK